MKENELLYTILDLEEWNQGATCRFCRGLNKAVCQIRTRNKVTHSIVENDYACENCKEKFENDELPKCERCGRLQTKLNIDMSCDCIRDNEDLEEKELPVLPHEERAATRYERQIKKLQEKLNEAEWTITEEREAHEDFMEKSEEWGKRQKQELLDKIAQLEEENKKLKEQNKKITPQALVDEIESHKKEIESLKGQLEQFQKQTAQIEVPPKENKIKNFFKLGSK